ncbi:DUF1294 domain-containing protein [Rahnella woolbedingensis]|uniref:DUF1294 domain-containing protein n=1 Tax=Rahnella woolbedingensis TaxID=1510574 RepID=A0A419N5R4_9GAMM|nr:DUF1294 domain-containing protein [Rahnella woolbedingensis]RJT41600.1 DUF1294 domain-containing protein [Rahnella woolbedingensis]
MNSACYVLLVLVVGTSLITPYPVWIGLHLLNLLTLLIYGADKLAACRGWRRIPENTLLLFGLLGGWIGALVGQQLFRHKTHKQPFRTWFMLSIAANIAAVSVGVWLMYGR